MTTGYFYTAKTVNRAEEIYSILKERNPDKHVKVVYDASAKVYEIHVVDQVVTRRGAASQETASLPVHVALKVVYGDTDSIFIEMKYNRDNHVLNRHDTFKLASVCGRNLTDKVFNRKPIEMEFEKVFQPFILLTKKRYIGKKFEDLADPMKMKEITAAGIAITRRDYTEFVKSCYKGVIDKIINNGDVDSGIAMYKEYISMLENDTVDIDSLVLTKLLAKEYKTTPVHVVLAEKLKGRNEEVQIGDRIAFLYIQSDDKTLKKSDLGEDPDYVKAHNLKINKAMYLEQLAKTMLGFFKVVLINDAVKMNKVIALSNEKLVAFGGKALKAADFIIHTDDAD